MRGMTFKTRGYDPGNYALVNQKAEPKKAVYKRVEKEEVNTYDNKERKTKKW